MTRPGRSVICISRAVGAAGEEVGRLVAQRLGFRYVDEDIVVWAAEKAGVKPADVAEAERRTSRLRRLLDDLGTGGAAEASAYVGFAPALGEAGPRGDDLRHLIREVIEETADQGNAVIVAHAASYALAGRTDVLRVLVTASPETRAQRLAATGGGGEKDAAKRIKSSDAGRADYLRRFYKVDSELPTHYDLVVSTDVLTAEETAEIIVHAAAPPRAPGASRG